LNTWLLPVVVAVGLTQTVARGAEALVDYSLTLEALLIRLLLQPHTRLRLAAEVLVVRQQQIALARAGWVVFRLGIQLLLAAVQKLKPLVEVAALLLELELTPTKTAGLEQAAHNLLM